MNGRFITLEGIEGAGKSTLARHLGARLQESGRTVVVTREPGGTPLAEKIRALVLERSAERVSTATETLLMFAARAVHVDNQIRPALARGDWVLCDRFTDATRAYQGFGRGVDAATLDVLAHLAHAQLQPDLTLLLDLPAPDGLARTRSRGQVADRIESEALAFFERVRDGYLQLARAEPSRFVVLDARLDEAKLADAAWQAVATRLPA
jgi:dTMP kinase